MFKYLARLKYKIRLNIEWKYFHFWRKSYEYSYDETDNKWKKSKMSWTAKDKTYDWFNGMYSILAAMKQKNFWCWYKIRKDGNTSESYITSDKFLEVATENDINLIKEKVFDDIKQERKTAFSRHNKEDKSVSFWIDTLEIDKKYSDDGFVSIYLEKFGPIFEVKAYTSKEMTSEKKPKYFSFDDKTKKFKPAKRYSCKKEYRLGSFSVSDSSNTFYNILGAMVKSIKIEDQEFSIENVDKILIENYQVIDIMPWELNNYEAKQEIKKNIYGRLWQLRAFAHFNHLLNKVINISEIDYLDWIYIVDEEEREKVRIKEMQDYKKAISDGYHDVMNFMIENHDSLWD